MNREEMLSIVGREVNAIKEYAKELELCSTMLDNSLRGRADMTFSHLESINKLMNNTTISERLGRIQNALGERAKTKVHELCGITDTSSRKNDNTKRVRRTKEEQVENSSKVLMLVRDEPGHKQSYYSSKIYGEGHGGCHFLFMNFIKNNQVAMDENKGLKITEEGLNYLKRWEEAKSLVANVDEGMAAE